MTRMNIDQLESVFIRDLPDPNSARLFLERLEKELGKPVLVNNAVSLWAGMRLLKRNDSIPGYGRLLRDHLAA